MFKDRKEHAQRTADLVRECVDATPGNVAVYFPSFAMLDDITSRWTDLGESLMVQYPNMSETARADWLDRICEGGPQKVLAAVLGGIFAEGVDLPSGTLSAVVIAGPALPPVGLERDLLQTCYQERYGAGFQYASLIPGMTKVIQAAGRLLRSPEDKGVIVLIGRRFLWRDYVSLLPDWWHVERPDEPVEAIKAFWDSVSEF
jgi:DNA excision repair protein ERCC-2